MQNEVGVGELTKVGPLLRALFGVHEHPDELDRDARERVQSEPVDVAWNERWMSAGVW